MINVAILVHETAALFELACAVEIFALERPEYPEWYQTQVVSFENSLLSATGGTQLLVQKTYDLSQYDMLIIPCWNTKNKHLRLDLAEQIVAFAHQGKRIVSFCSGSFLLAQLGLLNGIKATTHWRYSELFTQRFPLVDFVNDVLFTQQSNIYSSAGSSAALDLGLEIVRQDYGHSIANQVARRLVISPHRNGGQAQFVQTPITKKVGTFAATLDWAINNLCSAIAVEDLAEQAKMSRRSFDRHFRKSVGQSPKSWLNQQRINLAKDILEHEHVSIEQLAQRVGFENGITLRFNFNKFVGIAPSQYREQFAEAMD